VFNAVFIHVELR